MKSYHLATREVIDAHTAETLSQELSDVIIEWEIDGKIFGITTDNAKNVTNAVVTLDYIHFGCIGHTPQLSISKGTQLGFIVRVLGRVHKLIEHFHRSTNTMYGLWKKQELLGIPEHAMIKQCETRWNSTFAMLERVIKQQQAICAVLLESQDRVLCNLLPDGKEQIIIEELLAILKPFAIAKYQSSQWIIIRYHQYCLSPYLQICLNLCGEDGDNVRK